MPAYSPEPWIYNKDYGAVVDAMGQTVATLPLNDVAKVNGLLIAHAMLLLEALRELHDAANKSDDYHDIADAMDQALALLEKLE